MKALGLVTLALHFSAVMILVGSLVLVCYFGVTGRARKDADQLSTAFVLARRLPVIMTYVINLGIPPLLFAQVLYGRALYSSSILIGAVWFSVIPLVMLDYWLIYRIAPRVESGKAVLPYALAALLVTMGIGHIYSMNMTLMLRPEVWAGLYAHSPSGLQGAHDPTTTPRWLFVMCGGLVFGGLWAVVLSNMRHISEGVQRHLRRAGGFSALVGAVTQLGCGVLVSASQPETVRQGLAAHPIYGIAAVIFLVTLVAAAGLAAFQGAANRSNPLLGGLGLVAGLLSAIGAVIYRDGIRDVTLQQKGLDVWNRTVVSNWSVIGLFLLLFVIMIGVLVWLLNVMRQATPTTEQVAQ
jgi:hypothetical protein